MLEKVLESLREELGEGYEVESRKVTKNNGLELTGICIRKGDERISPTIYVDRMLEQFDTAEEVADKVMSIYRDNADSGVNVEGLFNKETVLDNLFYKVIGKKNNEGFLKNKPYKDLLDLAIVYVYRIQMVGGSGTVTLDFANMQALGITEEELDEAVLKNLSKEEYEVLPMRQMLEEMSGHEVPEEMSAPMWVVSNKSRVFGATVLTRKDVFNKLAKDLGKDLLIIPSSVHEIIVLPDEGEKVGMLYSMVKEVNMTQVAPDEVLSDSVYRYILAENRIEVA